MNENEALITVVVYNAKGDSYRRFYKAEADTRDAIRWTIESEDLPFYAPGPITKVEVFPYKEDEENGESQSNLI